MGVSPFCRSLVGGGLKIWQKWQSSFTPHLLSDATRMPKNDETKHLIFLIVFVAALEVEQLSGRKFFRCRENYDTLILLIFNT
jgi:hypothetical protein